MADRRETIAGSVNDSTGLSTTDAQPLGRDLLIERATQLAARADSIIADNPNAGDVKEFGNHFFTYFYAMRTEAQVKSGLVDKSKLEANPHAQIQLSRLRRIGKPWQAFTTKNGKLLADIFAALDDYEVYMNLKTRIASLLRGQQDQAYDSMNQVIHPQLGAEAVSIVVIDRLNPLLEQAAEAMRQEGIDTEPFFP